MLKGEVKAKGRWAEPEIVKALDWYDSLKKEGQETPQAYESPLYSGSRMCVACQKTGKSTDAISGVGTQAERPAACLWRAVELGRWIKTRTLEARRPIELLCGGATHPLLSPGCEATARSERPMYIQARRHKLGSHPCSFANPSRTTGPNEPSKDVGLNTASFLVKLLLPTVSTPLWTKRYTSQFRVYGLVGRSH